jgi:2-isopropylmalate synthase
MKKQHIKIFDTTLRDGQQCPGAGMPFEKNIEYAKLAAKAGVDILEAGFPSASKTDYMIVETIAHELMCEKNSPIIAGLCQLREKQVEITINALAEAQRHKKARVHLYLPVDPQLMNDSLGEQAKDKSQLIEEVYRLCHLAFKQGMEVQFSPEGYSKMGEHFDFVTDVIRAAVSAGVTTINCPDTIGGACRLQGKDYFVARMNQHAKLIQQEFPDKEVAWAVHCHNDFGLALDNSMNAVFSGPATQIEGCFNGVGERAGNVALEQCVMYLKKFGALGQDEKVFSTQINIDMLQTISDFVGHYMLTRQPHWPITGENAARHSSGGHTNAIIKNPLAYQPFDPREIGKEISFLFGPLSGGNHAKNIIEQCGYVCEEDEKAKIAQFIKDYYVDRRKGITDQELLQAYLYYRKPIKATQFDYAKQGEHSVLKIMGSFFNHADSHEVSCDGADSALAALHNAIKQHMQEIHIESYHSQSVTSDISSVGQSKITISNGQKEFFSGVGEDQDIQLSALKALVDAVNQAYIHQHYRIGTIV